MHKNLKYIFIIIVMILVSIVFISKQESIILNGKIIYRTYLSNVLYIIFPFKIIDSCLERYVDDEKIGISNYKIIDLKNIDSAEEDNFLEFEKEDLKNIYKLNIKEENIINLGAFFGTPAFSNNGKKIALNCGDDLYQLCILELKKSNLFSSENTYSFNIINEIEIPAQCDGLLDEEYGLTSISWSPKDDKIIIVCGNNVGYANTTTSNICIVDLKTEKSNCINDDIVSHAIWSPVNNQVLLMAFDNKNPKIYLSYIDHLDNKEFLFDGRMAEWSPDGKEIIYLQDFSKIFIYNLKEKDVKKVYDMKDTMFGNGIFIDDTPYFSWSPNSKQVIFQANIGGGYNINILIFDLVSQEMILVSGFEKYDVFSINPSWGK